MVERLIDERGAYGAKGGIHYAIGRLMEVNNMLFDASNAVGPASGLLLDFKPIYKALSDMIEELRVSLEGFDNANEK